MGANSTEAPANEIGPPIRRLPVETKAPTIETEAMLAATDPEVTDPRGTRAPTYSADDVQAFWVYKRGQLVLTFTSEPGFFVPTRGPRPGDDPKWYAGCAYASGQMMSVEWEPRVRMIHARAKDLVDFIERLEDRRYEVDLEPPSRQNRPHRSL